MKTPVLSIVSGDFNIDWNMEVQKATELRRSKMSQSEIAKEIKVSLKTIQRFENYECHNPEILYKYKILLTE